MEEEEEEEVQQDSDSNSKNSKNKNGKFAVVRTPVESMSSPARSEYSLSAPVPTWFSRSLMDAAELGDILKKVMMRRVVARAKERNNGKNGGNSRLIAAL